MVPPSRAGLTDPDEVLQAMRQCRAAMAQLCAAYKPRSAIYREAMTLQKDIDDLALLITGKRDYFLSAPHSTP